MNWQTIEVEDGPDAGDFWLKATVGPFEIDVFPPDREGEEWYFTVSAAGADDIVEGYADDRNGAQRKALFWLANECVGWRAECNKALELMP
jgi:hypothetical protein